MTKCMACGKMALLTTAIGNVILCKNCANNIGTPIWIGRDCATRDELLNHKNNAVKSAIANGFPNGVIVEITRFFDEYLNIGYVTTINGKAGQILKVFSNFCIIETKSETKKTDLESYFRQFEPKDYDEIDDSMLSNEDKKRLAKSLLNGKIVKTGIDVAMNATFKQQEKEKQAEQKERERKKKVDKLISLGEKRVFYRNISHVETYSRLNTHNGYLKFIPRGVKDCNLYDCDYFFFNNSIPFDNKKIRQKVENVKNFINERIVLGIDNIDVAKRQTSQNNVEQQMLLQAEQIKNIVVQATEQLNQQSVQQNKPDAFEEIRKFKQLLDEGIISEDEFNAKKKELLGL